MFLSVEKEMSVILCATGMTSSGEAAVPTDRDQDGCDSIGAMTVVNATATRLRFRRSGATWLAALLVLVFVVPFASGVFIELRDTTRILLAPVAVIAVLIPLLIAVWSLRSGVDVGSDGLRVKALFSSRHVAWSAVQGFDSTTPTVYAVLNDGAMLALPNVRAVDLPQLIAVSGNELVISKEESDTDQ